MRIAAFLLTLLAAGPAAAGALPFEGRWSGGPATCRSPFRITPRTYAAPGTKPSPIRTVERSHGWWRVELVDGYSVTLMDVKPRSMTWHSPASGGSFPLVRCP
jgi:hypothetical protein